MELDENSGLTGFLMTVIVYLGTAIVTGLVLYEYMVRVHKNGRYVSLPHPLLSVRPDLLR